MVRWSALVLCLAGLSTAGCYRSHRAPESDAGARPDAGAPIDAGSRRRDAGPPAPGFDAGPPRPLDDAGPPLPREDDPPIGPGERPSDRPDSEDWTDPAPPPEPCCDLGEPIMVTPPELQGGTVRVEWHGLGWGVLIAGTDGWGPLLQYASLDPLVSRVETYRHVPTEGHIIADVAWAAGRFGVTYEPSWATASLGFLDRNGVLDGAWRPLRASTVSAIARQPLGGLWAVVAGEETDAEHARLVVRGFDDDGVVRAQHAIDGSIAEGYDAIALEALGSRVVAAWPEAGALEGRLRAQSVVVGEGPVGTVADLGPIHLSSDAELGSAPIRDAIAITHIQDGGVWITLYDPFEATSVRHRVGDSRVGDREAAVVGVDKLGLIGVCIPTGRGPGGGGGGDGMDGVAFRILAADGTPWSDPIEIVGGLENIGGCAVAFHLDAFVVVWWRASGSVEYNSIWARRVAPRL